MRFLALALVAMASTVATACKCGGVNNDPLATELCCARVEGGVYSAADKDCRKASLDSQFKLIFFQDCCVQADKNSDCVPPL